MISTCTRGVDLGAHNPPALLIDEHRSTSRRLNLFSTSICCIVSNSGARLQWWNSGGRGREVGDLTNSFLILWLFTIQSNIYIPLLINRLRWDVSKPTTCWKFRHAIWLASIIRFANQIQRSHHHSAKSNSSDILPFNRNPRAQQFPLLWDGSALHHG